MGRSPGSTKRCGRESRACASGTGPAAAERDALLRRLAALPTPAVPETALLEELAVMLRDAQAPWDDADQDARNALAKALFDETRVLGAEVVAI
jgi:hypothetical protein